MAQFGFNPASIGDFDAVRLAVASPEDVLKWSHGEVTKHSWSSRSTAGHRLRFLPARRQWSR